MKCLSCSTLILLFGLLLFNCNNDDERTEWSIPSDLVFDGGPGQDGIPSIDNPSFSSISEIDFLTNSDLVVGVFSDTEVKAYPHPILDWHEIVNDNIGDKSVAVTYCPLTGTAVGWDRNVNGTNTTFGVSGKLFNSNLMPFDRSTESYWSQMRLDCVNGDLINTVIETSPVIETSWSTWKEMYPNSSVMNTNTGFNRNYQLFPYGDYITNNTNFLFPVDPFDTRLPAKERALVVLSETTNKAYSIREFDAPQVINDNIDGQAIVVIGSREKNFIVAYEDNALVEGLSIDMENLPVIATAPNGNQVTLFGQILNSSGNPIGQLNTTESFIGYWFSLGAFYPDLELY